MTVPSPIDLKNQLPLSPLIQSSIANYRTQITHLVRGKDPRLAIILGPCSLHDEASALEYAHLVKKLQKKVENTCLLVMRAHIEKPRTCLGWKGLLYDPFLTGDEDLLQGLFISRAILLSLANLQIPLASEFLDPLTCCYFSDLISWGVIGARTSSSQVHRQLASALQMPVGFKNTTDGNIEIALQGAFTAQHPHRFLHMDESGKIDLIQSKGNLATHIILRGSDTGPNYEPSYLEYALEKSLSLQLQNRILVDCSHGNSQKDPMNQKAVFSSILEQLMEGNSWILGMMLESHLEPGSQILSSSPNPSVSLTDPCLGWSETEELVSWLDETLSSSLLSSI